MMASAQALFDRLVNELEFNVIKLELTEATGLTGLYPDFSLGDAGLNWLWEAANDQGLTVTLDLGPIGGRSYQTAEVERLVARYPQARWVITHMGQPSPQARLEPDVETAWVRQVSLARQTNVWLDLASLASYFPDEDYPYPSVSYFVCKAKELVGAEKLLWGTDAPGLLVHLTYMQMRDLVNHWDCLSRTEKQLVWGANALAAYG
jgi:predicted TIM-barrel fold metal-dependent hydrolase